MLDCFYVNFKFRMLFCLMLRSACFRMFDLVDFRFAWHECVHVVYVVLCFVLLDMPLCDGCAVPVVFVFVPTCFLAVACLIVLDLICFKRALRDCLRMHAFGIVHC